MYQQSERLQVCSSCVWQSYRSPANYRRYLKEGRIKRFVGNVYFQFSFLICCGFFLITYLIPFNVYCVLRLPSPVRYPLDCVFMLQIGWFAFVFGVLQKMLIATSEETGCSCLLLSLIDNQSMVECRLFLLLFFDDENMLND